MRHGQQEVGGSVMVDVRSAPRAEGDQEALLCIFQIVAGVAAWLLVASMVTPGVPGEILGFVAMCAAQYPFARRTWAADISARRYMLGVLIATIVGAGLRVATM